MHQKMPEALSKCRRLLTSGSSNPSAHPQSLVRMKSQDSAKENDRVLKRPLATQLGFNLLRLSLPFSSEIEK